MPRKSGSEVRSKRHMKGKCKGGRRKKYGITHEFDPKGLMRSLEKARDE